MTHAGGCLYRLQAAVAQGILKEKFKTELCAHKVCSRGAECWFYHSQQDRLPLTGYKGQLCRAWQARHTLLHGLSRIPQFSWCSCVT
jgi:hypothetical protein